MVSCNPGKAQFSFELNAGTKRFAVYIKDFQYIDKSNRLSFYSLTRIGVVYDEGKPGFLSLNMLVYNFRSGFGLGTVIISGKSRLHPSAGVQYQKMLGSFYFYFLSTYELNELIQQENYFTLVYKQKLSGKINFIFQNENYISILKWHYDQSFQRVKTGLEIGKIQVGFIGESSQTEEKQKTMLVNLGCFIKQSF